jgi:MoaA/NifB/PqqE/SkfB family radical SAM enzyme
MSLKVGDVTLYQSMFDERTGTLVRLFTDDQEALNAYMDELRKKFGHYVSEVASPVPETIDVTITDKCGFGCPYCYMDSTPEGKHGPVDLLDVIIKGFDEPPYQVAIGGGEPTLHPDFPNILRRCRELGTVPNYTTAGAHLSDEVIEATNKYCGGVAMTFHAFRGIDWFVQHFTRLREALRVQMNVHLIADRDVAKNLMALVSRRDELGYINVVLLAYYPDVGRASIDTLMTKQVYMRDLPEAIKAARNAPFNIAFSEGLLSFFLSRPWLGVNTKFAARSEGRFSCYFNAKGQISQSSFHPPYEKGPTAFEVRSQELWNKLVGYCYGRPIGTECVDCHLSQVCANPSEFHYLTCAFAAHNRRS